MGEDRRADVTGAYFYHLKRMAPNPQALEVALQEDLLARCEALSGVAMPPADVAGCLLYTSRCV